MVFNPSKCFFVSTSRGSTHLPHFYEPCGVVLKCVENDKYLGVTLSRDLTWRSHNAKILTKGNRKLGFIKRNLRGSSRELKLLAYIAFVRSGLEYANVVWDPHLAKDRDSFEKTQRRAARWITSTYTWKASGTDLLTQLKLEALEGRRRMSHLVFMYKILNGHVAVPPEHMDLSLNQRPVRGNLTKQRWIVPRVKHTDFGNSFTSLTVEQWNCLKDSITSAYSISSLRSRLTKKCP